MKKGGGYAMAAYLLDRDGADEVLMTYLRGSVSQTLKYDDRATAIAWGGQILAALRDDLSPVPRWQRSRLSGTSPGG